MEQLTQNLDLDLALAIENEWDLTKGDCDLCNDEFYYIKSFNRKMKCPDCFAAAIEYRLQYSYKVPDYLIEELIS